MIPRDWKVIIWVEHPEFGKIKGAVAVVPAHVPKDEVLEHKAVADLKKKLRDTLYHKVIDGGELTTEIWEER